jgi:hypothetical protein
MDAAPTFRNRDPENGQYGDSYYIAAIEFTACCRQTPFARSTGVSGGWGALLPSPRFVWRVLPVTSSLES